jgi:hypothetical protein
VVYRCDGEQHRVFLDALRTAGIDLTEAGPESTYARDIRASQRWADAGQFGRALSEISRLRASIVMTLEGGDLSHVREALDHSERLEWDWNAKGARAVNDQKAVPERIQLSRKKGWRKPEGAVVVARPSKWGNPYRVIGTTGRADAVELFRVLLRDSPVLQKEAREDLAGRDLACWCPLDEPCHADVLLDFANGAPMPPPERIIDVGGVHRFDIHDDVSWQGQQAKVIALTVEPSVTIEFPEGRRLTVGQSALRIVRGSNRD